ncbi:hypothetical protein C672_3666 [[Clostridium] bifermentans ATCC 638]|uniref:Uncharacterized protein n=1 Tax=Paraclostridium bifermentans ATCC 638 = DSM 14991 TaxID=1233171 RepID=T4VF56_PARBF|nr:hypothetical protein C672_3666 [[Clostridium] bifermentans ATCC 638] [Paraclostridium bifermentans ATCC 638 = DSM 14991]
MRTIKCLECGKEFEDYRTKRKYCSRRCRLDNKYKRIKGE